MCAGTFLLKGGYRPPPKIMKAVNADYHADLKGCDGCKTDAHTYKYKQDIEQELIDKLQDLLKLRNLHIALIGYWIWVSGDTKPHKETLKQAGLLRHTKRKCWYYKPKDWKCSYHSIHSLEELAQKYGYKNFQTATKEYMPTATQS